MFKPSGLIRLRYRDRFVWLHSAGNQCGTMTRYEDGVIEFDFSQCEVIRTEIIEEPKATHSTSVKELIEKQ